MHTRVRVHVKLLHVKQIKLFPISEFIYYQHWMSYACNICCTFKINNYNHLLLDTTEGSRLI